MCHGKKEMGIWEHSEFPEEGRDFLQVARTSLFFIHNDMVMQNRVMGSMGLG